MNSQLLHFDIDPAAECFEEVQAETTQHPGYPARTVYYCSCGAEWMDYVMVDLLDQASVGHSKQIERYEYNHL